MNIEEIAKIIKQSGGTLYLVGGAVRDKYLERESFDEDYCVTGISEGEFIKLFPTAIPRGKSFKVFDLDGKEFALARLEQKIGKGHKEFKIIADENIKIEEDLKRRDITINSIAQNVLSKEIVDPFNGISDIQHKLIKATSEKFKEDPLRVYRVARFASQLNFEVEKETLEIMNILKSELKTLSKERIFCEFRKALATNKPSVFFNVLKEADVLDIHFKEIYDLIGSIQPVKYHPEIDSYNHTMLVIDNCALMTNNLLIRYAALVHDLGKGRTPKEMYPHHYGHEENGIEPVMNLSNRIGVPRTWKKAGITATKEHMRGRNI